MNNPFNIRFIRVSFTTMLLLVVFVLLSPVADASPPVPDNDGWFAPLWNFLDWIYSLWVDFKNWLLTFLIELILYFELLWLYLKLSLIELTWSIVYPVIQNLDLTNTIAQAFGNLDPAIQSYATTFRIGEAVNILASAKLTKMVLSWF